MKREHLPLAGSPWLTNATRKGSTPQQTSELWAAQPAGHVGQETGLPASPSGSERSSRDGSQSGLDSAAAAVMSHWTDSRPNAEPASEAVSASAPLGAARAGICGPGSALPFVNQIQSAFGRHDISGVRAHQGPRAAASVRALGSTAFAFGSDVAFDGAPSLHMVAHEAAHVVQQRRGVDVRGGLGQTGDDYEQHANQVADRVVRGESCEDLLGEPSHASSPTPSPAIQRYEAGEHAKTGDTQEQLKRAYAPIQYVVVKHDTLESIADKFQLSMDDVKKANRNQLKKWPNKHDGKRMEEGFEAGAHVTIPQKLNDMARDAIKHPSIQVHVGDVALDYGAVIAMGGDLYGSPEELAKAPPAELQAIAALIAEEKKTGKPASTERWQSATHGRFLKLAANNDAHFAPSDPSLVAVSGKSSGDHKQSWEDYHRRALLAARDGKKDSALLINAFGDHFLTDAFSAGHLFNKRDVMEQFNSQLTTTGNGTHRKFTKDSKTFFDSIAGAAFVGNVATEFSRYETVERHYGFYPNINSSSRFSDLLQAIHLEKPELLEGAVAKGVHDKLNTHSGGLPVQNALGDKWSLSGDNTLNAETLAVAQRAVAQSQQNVIAAYHAPSQPNYPALFKQVWDFTPRPTAESRTLITGAVSSSADVKGNDLRATIVNLIHSNYMTIISELVNLKKLKLDV